MTVIVTGAAGFIGNHLTKALQLTGDVVCCDPASDQMISPAACVSMLEDKNVDIECVYHLGAISSTTETNIGRLTENNIKLSAVLMGICIERRIPLVYASSASVYGLGDKGFTESAGTAPLNYYAISKAVVDMYAQQKIEDNPEAKIFGLRYFNVYGTGEEHKQDMASPVYKFLKQARQSGQIKIFEGSDGFLRDFVHVNDIVSMTMAATNLNTPGIYNAGTGISRSFDEVASIVASLTGASIREVDFPPHLRGKYQTFTQSDNEKINLNGYLRPRLTLEEGIAEVLDGS